MHCIFRLLYKRPAETGISAVYRPTTNNVAFNRTPHFISGRGACEWKGTLATIRTILQLLSVLRHLKQFWLLKCKLKILSERLTLHSLITFLPDRNVSTADKWDLHHYEIRYFFQIYYKLTKQTKACLVTCILGAQIHHEIYLCGLFDDRNLYNNLLRYLI